MNSENTVADRLLDDARKKTARQEKPASGKAALIVNVASKCGLTPQYEGLERIHERFADRGFAVLGFPCNQFGGQEPGTAEEIGAFCDRSYSVSFPIFAKVEVNGAAASPLFAHLKRERPGLLGSQAIKWNFTKFLVGRDGGVIERFAPSTKPEAIEAAIARALAVPVPS